MLKDSQFTRKLINWYQQNKRDLPWRDTKDPFKIWLSEIILQQTRVEQGLPYYLRFTEKFKTVSDLANSKEQDVLKLWQGLGYYSRARNLHETAKTITNHLDGNFPKTYKELLNLKGIGSYTASAIMSFAFKEAYPALDGNAFRVLSRVFNIKEFIDVASGVNVFLKKAQKLISKKKPDLYNQAIMEFGATACTPKNPLCQDCIFKVNCIAFIENTIQLLPYKKKKTKVKTTYFNYLILKRNNYFYIKKRTATGIWKNLFDFPLIESTAKLDTEKEVLKLFDAKNIGKYSLIKKSTQITHLLSHIKIKATFWLFSCDKNISIKKDYLLVDKISIEKYPLPKLISKGMNIFYPLL